MRFLNCERVVLCCVKLCANARNIKIKRFNKDIFSFENLYADLFINQRSEWTVRLTIVKRNSGKI